MKKNIVSLAILISLLMHLLLAVVIWVQPFRSPTPTKPANNLEVELLSPQDLLKKMKAPQHPMKGQIVEQSEQAINDQLAPDAKYLSRHNQTVEKQTRAPLPGKFRNSQTTGGPPRPVQHVARAQKPTPRRKSNTSSEEKESAQNEPSESNKPHKTYLTNANGERILPELRDLKPEFHHTYKPPVDQEVASGGGDAPSNADDHLKDIPIGMQTLLSTREFIYYSYYARIKDKLRQYWEPKIKEKMERILRQGRTIATADDKITKIVIVLDAHGTLVHVQIVGASGLVDLDEAAVEAFKAAAPFPNPPKGIVEPDGTIHIRWDFVLEA